MVQAMETYCPPHPGGGQAPFVSATFAIVNNFRMALSDGRVRLSTIVWLLEGPC